MINLLLINRAAHYLVKDMLHSACGGSGFRHIQAAFSLNSLINVRSPLINLLTVEAFQ